MKIIRNAGGAPFAVGEVVAALGMFDGVHRGHQAILRRAVGLAKTSGCLSAAITFDSHPRAVLSPQGAPPMITSLEHRLVLFSGLGLDAALVLPFTPELSRMGAGEFLRQYVADFFGARRLVLGENAHLGRNREGTARNLAELGASCGVAVEIVPPVNFAGERISSTRVRMAVLAGRLDEASAMLGRPVSVLGEVRPGRQAGRELGFPTVNLDPHHELSPPPGVYATRARCGDALRDGVTNVGSSPTFPGAAGRATIETHILDFSGDLYGQTVEILFLKRLRDELRFSSPAELAAQIARDVHAARAALAECDAGI